MAARWIIVDGQEAGRWLGWRERTAPATFRYCDVTPTAGDPIGCWYNPAEAGADAPAHCLARMQALGVVEGAR